MKYSIAISLFLISFLGFYSNAGAQAFSQADTGDIIIEMIPEVPKANEIVSVSTKSYLYDINALQFTWKVNGKTIKSGTGEKNFSFTMGDMGQRTNIDIIIVTPNGATIQKNYQLVPTSVDLVWQSNGYVPPFYKGKAMFTHQNTASIVAIPHIPNSNGTEMNPKTMIYRWKKNGSVVENASGYGKNVFNIEGSLISRNVTVSVEVSPEDGGGLAYSTIVLNPRETALQFYKKDPIYGIQFQKSLSLNETLTQSNEISIMSVPFFFESSEYKSGYLVYNWSINGKKIEGNGNPLQVFRQIEGTEGTSRISLNVENPNRPLQFITKSMNLTFKNGEN